MIARSATQADLPAITDLGSRSDVYWFGAAERDEAEMAEDLSRCTDLAAHSLLLFDEPVDELVNEGGNPPLVGAVWSWDGGSTLLRDPARDGPQLRAALLDALPAAGEIEALVHDLAFVHDLAARGRRHRRSSFELLMPVDEAAHLPAPSWPAGVGPRPVRNEELPAVHRLIFTDARWADTDGHDERGFDQWREVFLPPAVPLPLQVVAWRGDRPVGVAVNRVWSDGTGWVSQLAVAEGEQGHGLGRALLLAALERLRAAGARQLGLAVVARNERALNLYRSVGLAIDREWQVWG